MKYPDQSNLKFTLEIHLKDDFFITKKNMEAAMDVSPELQCLVCVRKLEYVESAGPEPCLNLEKLQYTWPFNNHTPVAVFLYALLSDLSTEKYGHNVFNMCGQCDVYKERIFYEKMSSSPWHKIPKDATYPESEEELVQLYTRAIQLLFGENAPNFTMDYMAVKQEIA